RSSPHVLSQPPLPSPPPPMLFIRTWRQHQQCARHCRTSLTPPLLLSYPPPFPPFSSCLFLPPNPPPLSSSGRP
ncbi:unnamed protein product, partial [Closterium sp. NIES-65]